MVNQGIRSFVVDNEVDLDVMEEFLEDNTSTLTLYIRIKLKENTIRTEKYYVFGMDSEVVNQTKQDFVMIKVDLTGKSDPLHERLLQEFNIRGVPTLVFLSRRGEEVETRR